jgi:hypothetical protein
MGAFYTKHNPSTKPSLAQTFAKKINNYNYIWWQRYTALYSASRYFSHLWLTPSLMKLQTHPDTEVSSSIVLTAAANWKTC